MTTALLPSKTWPCQPPTLFLNVFQLKEHIQDHKEKWLSFQKKYVKEIYFFEVHFCEFMLLYTI